MNPTPGQIIEALANDPERIILTLNPGELKHWDSLAHEAGKSTPEYIQTRLSILLTLLLTEHTDIQMGRFLGNAFSLDVANPKDYDPWTRYGGNHNRR